VTDTQAQQIVLDKTADDFRRLHAERQALVRQWEAAVAAMQARDRDIDAAGARFREGKAFLRQKAEAHAERDKALAEQLAANEKLAAEITNDERELWKVGRGEPPRARAEAGELSSRRLPFHAATAVSCRGGRGAGQPRSVARRLTLCIIKISRNSNHRTNQRIT
jgi:hypothetical protein